MATPISPPQATPASSPRATLASLPQATPISLPQRFDHALHGENVAAGWNLDRVVLGRRRDGSAVERRCDEATWSIQELAEEQHGVVARWQLIALGLGRGLIESRARSRHLVPLYRGVYAVGHRRISRHGRWMAAVLACGPGAVLSHGSAAHLWGMRGSRDPIEVVRTSGHGGHPGIRVHQPRVLPPAELTIEAGIPVTTIERTLRDIAARLDHRALERAVVEADRSGRLRWPELVRIAEEAGPRKGAGRLRAVVASTDPRAAETRSPAEVDFLGICRAAGLPHPLVNVLVEGHLVDFLWADRRVIVEIDGYAYHRNRPAFERDHATTVALSLAGYQVHRVSYRMLCDNPGAIVELLRRSLSA